MLLFDLVFTLQIQPACCHAKTASILSHLGLHSESVLVYTGRFETRDDVEVRASSLIITLQTLFPINASDLTAEFIDVLIAISRILILDLDQSFAISSDSRSAFKLYWILSQI